jgi:hypothetical protein
MKQFFFAAVLIVICGVVSYGQGNSLKFNRVIDTALVAEITNCIDISGSGYTGASITVPSGTVWKIESVGPLGYNSTSTLCTDCSYNACTSSYLIWDIKVDDGSVEKGFLKRRIYSGSYNIESIDGTAWLRAGTSISCHMSTSSPSYKYTYYASPTAPFYCRVHLTIIEFLVVPN